MTSPDLRRWFDMDAPIPVFLRGQYKTIDVATVAEMNPGYFAWLIQVADVSEDVKDVAREAIAGGYR
jgi:hypothetical protein